MDKDFAVGLFESIIGKENIHIDEPMRNHTSFKIGGTADLLLFPDNTEKLIEILNICKAKGIPFLTVGNGTNLLVRDNGIRGVVIKLFDKFNKVEVNGDVIIVEAGALLSTVSNIALKNELSGLEFASGIPGTIGGAIVMNAGAYGGEMKDVVVTTHFIDIDGKTKVINGDEHEFGYRTSLIQNKGGIVIKSELKLKKGDKAAIKSLMDDLNKKRKDKQPIEFPSAGSVFKRPEGYFAGKLIEDCGLRGYRMGGAEVSGKHCGFIINTGNATAADVISLIKHIQSSVMNKFGVNLQTEVRIVGEE